MLRSRRLTSPKRGSGDDNTGDFQIEITGVILYLLIRDEH